MDINSSPQSAGTLELQGVPNGTWIAEWMNTLDGTSIRTELVESADHQLVLSTPAVEKSVAVRLQRV
ncbi:MAG: hypothetical protein GEV06_13175 [Luteitalea sp.]|nr:hypothetical protein [Luteitalea sp.]